MTRGGAAHLRLSAGRYACGVGRRWSSQQITSTASSAAVTCGGCLRTLAARKAWVRQVTIDVEAVIQRVLSRSSP